MNKRTKNLLLMGIAAAGLLGAAVSCQDYDSDIQGLDDRISAVEKTVKDLEAQIKSGAVITNVASAANGVTVTLSDGKTFTLTNGKDGANGADGKDGVNGTNGTNGTNGSVVTIGENGNWFIDGVDTGMPSRGANGEDGANGADGNDGAQGPQGPQGPQGENGADGKDATQVYYYPGTDGYFIKVTIVPGEDPVEEPTNISYISNDVVTAVWDTAEGVLCIFNVEGSDEPIKINLKSQLKSLAIIPEVVSPFFPYPLIEFYGIYSSQILGEDEPLEEGQFVRTNNPEVTYRVNPDNADLAAYSYSFLNRNVKVLVRSTGDESGLVEIVSQKGDANTGLTFGLAMNRGYYELLSEINKRGEQESNPKSSNNIYANIPIIALTATSNEDNSEVVSDYAAPYATELVEFSIINKNSYAKDELKRYDSEFSYTPSMALNYQSSINVIDSLETYAEDICQTLNEINAKHYYKVALDPAEVPGEDGKTNQQKFVTLSEDGTLKVDKEWLNKGTASIGRTPCVHVWSLADGVDGETYVLAEAYITIIITDKSAEELEPKTLYEKSVEFEYNELGTEKDPTVVEIPWEDVNAQIIDELGLSWRQFITNYDLENASATLTIDGEEVNIEDVPGIDYATDPKDCQADVNTSLIAVAFWNKINENCTGTISVVIPAKNPYADPDVVVNFNFTIKHSHVWPEFNETRLSSVANPNYPDYEVIEVMGKGKTTEGADGAAATTKWVFASEFYEHFHNYLQDPYEETPNHSKLKFYLPKLDENGMPISFLDKETQGTKQVGAEITPDRTEGGNYTSPQEIALVQPLEGESIDYVVTMFERLANNNVCEKSYIVRFTTPFKATLDAVTLKTVLTSIDAADVKENVNITDKAKTPVKILTKGVLVATNPYGITTDDINITYDLDFTNASGEFGDKLTIEGSKITWDNRGSVLQHDMTAAYKAYITVGNIWKTEVSAKVTVKATEK